MHGSSWRQTGSWKIMFDIDDFWYFRIGLTKLLFCTGFDVVILNILSRTIAGMNIMNALFMVVASLAAMLMSKGQ